MCDTLPEKAERNLFAEDFVNHILQRLEVPYQYHSGIADHRSRIYNAFNPEVRTVVGYSCNSHRGDMEAEFENIVDQIAIDGEAFCKYVTVLRSFVSPYPKPERLMLFCVKISMMAGKFYVHGYLSAPFVAVQVIIIMLYEVEMEEVDWIALNDLARSWTQDFVDMDKNNLSPDLTSDSERGNSNASNSPEPDRSGGEDRDSDPEELPDDGMHAYAGDSPSEEAVSSSSDSESIERPCGVKAGIIVKSLGSASDTSLSGSCGERNSEDSSHSYEDTSSDEESKQGKRTSSLNPKKYDSSPKTCEKDLSNVD